MMAFFIVSILVLSLIFSLVKYQALQRELFIAQSGVKTASRKLDEISSGSMSLALAVQSLLSHRVNIAQRKATMSQADIEVVKTLVQVLPETFKQLYDNNDNLEAALKSSLKEAKPGFQDIQNFMQKQSSDIKLMWMKNSPSALSSTLIKLADLMDPPT
jgi:hypothetical protein